METVQPGQGRRDQQFIILNEGIAYIQRVIGGNTDNDLGVCIKPVDTRNWRRPTEAELFGYDTIKEKKLCMRGRKLQVTHQKNRMMMFHNTPPCKTHISRNTGKRKH